MLQQTSECFEWNEHHDLLLWLLCIGGAFAPPGPARSGYAMLFRSHCALQYGDLSGSWSELVEFSKEFIWSERAFELPTRSFWQESLGLMGS